ncbi:MAG: hypothetical protein IJZ42_13270 [Lachnospiraceae bacterium]|nr:hypothetical protein [Lachnospiraceae bacterium]
MSHEKDFLKKTVSSDKTKEAEPINNGTDAKQSADQKQTVIGTTGYSTSRTGYSQSQSNRTNARKPTGNSKQSNSDRYVVNEKQRFAYAKEVARESGRFVQGVYGAITTTAVDAARSEETGTVRQIDNFNEARHIVGNLMKASVDASRQASNTVKTVANAGTAVANAGRYFMGKETKEYRKLKTKSSVKRNDDSGFSDDDIDNLGKDGIKHLNASDLRKQLEINTLKDKYSSLEQQEASLRSSGKGTAKDFERIQKAKEKISKKIDSLENDWLSKQINQLQTENSALDKLEADLRNSGKGTAEQLASIQKARASNLKKISTLEQIQQTRVQAANDYGDLSGIKNPSKIKRIQKRTDKKVKAAQYEFAGGKKNFKEISNLDSKLGREDKSFEALRAEAASYKKEILVIQLKKNLTAEDIARIGELTADKATVQNILRDKATNISSLNTRKAQLGTIPSKDSLLSDGDKKRLKFLQDKQGRKNALDKMQKGKQGRQGLADAAGRIISKAAQESEEAGVQGAMRASRFVQNRYVRSTLKHFVSLTTSPARLLGKKVIAPAGSFVVKKIDSKLGISNSIQSGVAKAKVQILHSTPVVQVKNVGERVTQELNGGLYKKGVAFAQSKLEQVPFADKIHNRYTRFSNSKTANQESTQSSKDNFNDKQSSNGTNGSPNGDNKSKQTSSTNQRSTTRKNGPQSPSKPKNATGAASTVKDTGSKARAAAEKAADAAKKISEKAAELLKAIKGVLTKVLLVAGGALLLVAIVGALLTAAGGAVGSVISKDDSSDDSSSDVVTESGKIDLTTDVNLLMDIRDKWNLEINTKVQEAETERGAPFDNIKVNAYCYTPPRDSFVQIITMSSVCGKSDTENLSKIYEYLFYKMYPYEMEQSEYYSCDGCLTKKVYCSGCVNQGLTYCQGDCIDTAHVTLNEGTVNTDNSCPGHPKFTCPGHYIDYCHGKHQDLKIVIRELTVADLFKILNDDFNSNPTLFEYSEQFAGWDAENIAWVELILENVTDEIYEGLCLLDDLKIYKKE